MLRVIGGVVLGYLVMAVGVFALFSGLYAVLGADGAFEPNRYHTSATWIALSIPLGLAAAVAGGWVSRRVAGTPTGPRALAGLVLVLGLGLAAATALAPAPPDEPRPAGVGNLDAMQRARTPVWVAVLNPLIGVAGVLTGGYKRPPAS